jgi:UDP-N-acetylmuramoyl-tripeptide--D-alanyl-D-alanine ligase
MGMNHAGEIAALTRQVRPHVAAITNVEAVHMEFFGSLEGIAEAKSEIFEGLEPGGTAILNRDSPMYPVVLKAARAKGVKHIVTFGEHAEADCCLLEYRPVGNGCEISASIHGKDINYSLQAMGRQWAMSSLLTLATMHALGLDDAKTAKALAAFGELEGRGKVVQIGDMALIDDSYNASPAAMRAAFLKTAEVWESRGKKGRKLAALGDMLELGKDAPALHAGLAQDMKNAGFDAVFTAGNLMKHLHDALPQNLRAGHAAKAAELLPLLQKNLRAGDILLIKGSHGSKMYELAKTLSTDEGEKKHAV